MIRRFITRFKRFTRRFRKMGRGWIDPDKPYGHWSQGYYPPTMPKRGENREA